MPRPRWRQRVGRGAWLTACLAVLFAWALWLFAGQQLGRPDNGDGYRIAGSLRMLDADRTPARPFGPVVDAYRLPAARSSATDLPDATPVPASQWSPAALAARLLAAIAGTVGADGFGATTLALVWLPLPLLGLFLLTRHALTCAEAGSPAAVGARSAGILAFAVAIANPWALSWLRSPFEEAATVAVLPLWLALTWSGWHRADHRRFAAWLLVTLLLGASKVIWALICLPLLATVWRQSWPRRAFAAGVALLMLLVAAQHTARYREVNGFARVFFGVCLTESGVGLHPGRDLIAREAAFKASGTPACDRALAAFGLSAFAEWGGQSFWPLAADRIQPTDIARIRDHAGLGDFIRVMRDDPAIAIRFVLNAWGVAARSDYRVVYLLPRARAGLPWPEADPMPAFGGLAWIAAMLALLWRASRTDAAVSLALAALLLIAPLGVAAGNGFSDFEKHMLPFIHLSALVLAGTLAGAGRLPAATQRRCAS